MAGVDALSDHFSVWDVHDIHDPQLVDFVETGFPQVYDKVDTDRLEGEYFYVEVRPMWKCEGSAGTLHSRVSAKRVCA